MRKLFLAIAAVSIWGAISSSSATAQSSGCSVMPPGLQDLVGICETKEFKDYNGCVDKNIPEWAPARIQKKFPNMSMSAAAGVLEVLAECEPFARVFGERYSNRLANILQGVANNRIAKAYGTDPLQTPPCEENFIEYGQKLAVTSAKPGDVAVPPRTHTFPGEIRRP